MCNRSATLVTSPPTPETAPQKDDVKSVKAIEEAVLEVLPTAQQNFALTRDGAKILAYNPGAKKVGAILDDDSDTFMRNECRDDKWVVLELSQVAKVSRIEIIQHELYSSRIKEFEIRGRQSHPRTDNVETSKGLNSTAWKLLGKFKAQKAKGTQQFNVERPLWAHYLLIRFLTHYGSEPVCALNAFAVYGKSAAEELEDQLGEGELALEIESEEDRMRILDQAHANPPPLGGGSSSLSNSEKEVVGEVAAGGGGSEENASSAATAGDSNGDAKDSKSVLDVDDSKASENAQQQEQKHRTDDTTAAKDSNEKHAKSAASTKEDQIKLSDGSKATQENINQQQESKSAAEKAAAAGESNRAITNGNTDSAAAHGDISNSKGPEKQQSLSDTPSENLSTKTSESSSTDTHGSSSPTTTPGTISPSASEATALNATNGNASTPLTAPSTDSPSTLPTTKSPVQATGASSAGLSLPFDVFEPLPVPKMKTGGGVYEVLVQEIRVTKAQQRVTSKALEALQRNLTAATIALSRMKTEYELSDSDLGKKVDLMISEKLRHYEEEMIGLRTALQRAAKREHAALSLLAMLGGALVLSMQSSLTGKRSTWRKAKTVVVILAVANGVVGVALHWQSAGYLNILGSGSGNSNINGVGGSDYFLSNAAAAGGGGGAGAPSTSASPLP